MSNELDNNKPLYLDKNGNEIKAGMRLRMEDGSIELVYDTMDGYGNPDLGINASNEAFLRKHPEWAREYYSLSIFNTGAVETRPTILEIQAELSELEPFIQGVEFAIDTSEQLPDGDYERYLDCIARREELTDLLKTDAVPVRKERGDAR